MTHRFFAAVSLTAALALAGSAMAQPAGGGGGGVREVCQADMAKLCPDAKPGQGGGMRECIKSNWDKLSKPCQDAITKMRAERQSQGGGAGGGGQ